MRRGLAWAITVVSGDSACQARAQVSKLRGVCRFVARGPVRQAREDTGEIGPLFGHHLQQALDQRLVRSTVDAQLVAEPA